MRKHIGARRFSAALACVLGLLFVATTANAQAPVTVAGVIARINQERVTRGLVPYAANEKLTAAAQGQAADMSRSGKYSHKGSDGSTIFDRVARAGYGSYSWGRRVGENYAAYQDLATAMTFWMNSPAHRENILHPVYREVGVGIAPAKWGGTIIVLDFGAQPNVLPVFINDGSGQTRFPSVTLRLTNEDVFDVAINNIAHVTEVEVSNDPKFAGAIWQPYSPRMTWALSPGNGVKTVYVKYRDLRGRTVVSADSIVMGAAAAGAPNIVEVPTLQPSASMTSSVQPTATRTRTPRPTATLTRTPRPAPTRTRTPVPSPTPEPVDSPTPMAADVPSPEPTELPTQHPHAVTVARPAESETRTRVLAYNDQPTVKAPQVSSAGLAVTATPADPFAAGIFGVGLFLGLTALIRYRSRHKE